MTRDHSEERLEGVFGANLLGRLRQEDDPPSAFEALLAGPWNVTETSTVDGSTADAPATDAAMLNSAAGTAQSFKEPFGEQVPPVRHPGVPPGEPLFAVSRGEGGEPIAFCRGRQTALMLAAILPSLGRPDRFALRSEAGEGVLLEGGEPTARVGLEACEAAPGLHTLSCVLRSPASLSLLLEAAGSTSLERAGILLALRLEAGEG